MTIAQRLSHLLKRSSREAAKQLLPAAYARRYQLLHALTQKQPWQSLVEASERLGADIPCRLVGIDEYVNLPEASLTLLQRSTPSLSYSAPLFARVPQDLSRTLSPQTCPGPDRYAAVLKNATVIGASGVVAMPGHLALYDLHTFDVEGRFRHTNDGLSGNQGAFCLVKHDGDGEPMRRAIHLTGNYSFNYYHFMFEVLPRLQAIQALKLDPAIPLLVDQVVFKAPRYRELLDAINTENRPMVAVEPGKHHAVEELYFCSYPNVVVPNYVNVQTIRPEDTLFSVETLDFLRAKLSAHVERVCPKKTWPKRVFLSRLKASARRKFNEAETLAAMVDLGLTAVYPEEMTIAEQVAMFSQAELIVGGSGAAFSNLVFCQPDCKAMIFSKEPLKFGLFSSIAGHVGVRLFYFTALATAHATGPDPHESFDLDIPCLKTLISAWSRAPAAD